MYTYIYIYSRSGACASGLCLVDAAGADPIRFLSSVYVFLSLSQASRHIVVILHIMLYTKLHNIYTRQSSFFSRVAYIYARRC